MKTNNIVAVVLGLTLMLVVLFSCHKETSNPVVQQSEIGFKSNGKTKTLVDSDEDIVLTGGFRVYGHYSIGGGSEIYPVFDPDGNGVEEGVAVNDEDRDGDWDYSPKRYWLPGAEYSFLGIYPYDVPVIIPDQSSPLDFIYDHTDAECDFMAARVEDVTGKNSASGVHLQFEHMLANIRINLEREYILDFMSVESYTLSGMYAEASYEYSDEDQEWISTPSGDRSFSVIGAFDDPIEIPYGYSFALLGDEGINCVPGENVEGDVKLVLNCLVTVGGVDTSKEITLDFPAEIWERGKRYTYSAAIKSEDGGSGGDSSLEIDLDGFSFSGETVQLSCGGLEGTYATNIKIQYALSDIEPQGDMGWIDVDKFDYSSYGSTYFFDFTAPELGSDVKQTKLWVRIKCDSQYSNVDYAYFYKIDTQYVLKLKGQDRALTYDSTSGLIMTDYKDPPPSMGQLFQVLLYADAANLDSSLYTECKIGKVRLKTGSYYSYFWNYSSLSTTIMDYVATDVYFCAKEDGSYDIRVYNEDNESYDYMQSGVDDTYPVLGSASADKTHSWTLIPIPCQ